MSFTEKLKRLVPQRVKFQLIVVLMPKKYVTQVRDVAYSFLGKVPSRKTLRKMLLCHFRFCVSYKEFFLHECNVRSRQFIRNIISVRALSSLVNSVNAPEYYLLFKNKADTYRLFPEYYKRDIVEIKDDSEYGLFDTFTKVHNNLIVKPSGSSYGKGVKLLIRIPNSTEQFYDLRQEYPRGFVIEEYIQQDDRLSVLNASSLNTIRMPTFNTGKRIYFFPPFLRIGREGSVVDNANAGGISAIIDKESGKIIATTDLEKGASYEKHPDSGEPLLGFEIPRWDEAIAMTITLAQSIPQVPYVGWDLALSKDGWVLVEANYHGGLQSNQIALKRGFRKDFLELIEEYRRNNAADQGKP